MIVGRNIPPELLRKLDAERAQATAQMELAQDFHDAPGWRICGPDFYTCIMAPHMAVDRATLRRIHDFDPGLIPMVRKQRYLPPGQKEPVVVCHFALGRYVRNPRSARSGFHCEMPVDAGHPRPNLLEAVLEDRDLLMLQEGGPGGFQTFGPWLYHVLRAGYLNGSKTARQWQRERTLARRAIEDRQKAARASEMAYRQKGMERMHRRASELTNYDWQVYREAHRKRRALKPRVFLGGH